MKQQRYSGLEVLDLIMSNQGRGNNSGRFNNSNRSGKYGRGSYKSNSNNNNNRSNNNRKSNNNTTNTNRNSNSNNSKLEFTPHYSGKQQVVTYDTVKDHIIQLIQKNYKFGIDIVKAIRNDKYEVHPGGTQPTRQLATLTTSGGTTTTPTEAEIAAMKIEQDGFDILYREEIKEYNIRKVIYEDNKIKAYGLIFSHCNKVMQNRIEETPNFEADIRDDPLMLLREIKKKMYDPARAKYEFVTLTESLKRILSTTQENDEDLVQYTKRFK